MDDGEDRGCVAAIVGLFLMVLAVALVIGLLVSVAPGLCGSGRFDVSRMHCVDR